MCKYTCTQAEHFLERNNSPHICIHARRPSQLPQCGPGGSLFGSVIIGTLILLELHCLIVDLGKGVCHVSLHWIIADPVMK